LFRLLSFYSILFFPDSVKIVCYKPQGGEVPHDVPHSHACHVVFADKTKHGVGAFGVFEPDHVLNCIGKGLGTVVIGKKGGLHRCVVEDFRTFLPRTVDCLHVSEGFCLGFSADIGKRPVISVIGDTQKELLLRDLRFRIADDPPHLVDGGNRKGRGLGIVLPQWNNVPLNYKKLLTRIKVL